MIIKRCNIFCFIWSKNGYIVDKAKEIYGEGKGKTFVGPIILRRHNIEWDPLRFGR